MWITALLFGAVIALIFKWYHNRIHRQQTFQRSGIKGPEPHFLDGNFKELMSASRSKLLDWHKKYGKTFGYFDGDVPVLCTADLDIIRKVLVKDFSNFHSRKPQFYASSDDSIVHSRGERWKRQRMILSPAFSSRGIKEMSSMVNSTITKFMALLDQRADDGKAFDIMDDFQKLTLSAIACCGFGLDVDAVKNPDDIFLQKCKGVFTLKPSIFSKQIMMLSLLYRPLFSAIKKMFPGRFSLSTEWFFATSRAIIESRREKKGSRKDFIHLMLMAQEQEQEHPQDLESLEVNVDDDHKAKTEKTSFKTSQTTTKGKSMSMGEMQASCMTFLIAGFETTATTMSYLAYYLALHPEIQEKLQQEVDEHFPDDEHLPDYLSVQKLPYMEMVFSETLRLHPPAQIVQHRECFEDVTLKGIHLEKGSAVQVLVEVIQRDPELWGPEDPDDFVPERFLPERKSKRDSLAWMPFGAGPRNCIGMRFAIMEVKLTMTRLLKRFTIERCEETQVPVNVSPSGLGRPKEGIFVKIVKRE